MHLLLRDSSTNVDDFLLETSTVEEVSSSLSTVASSSSSSSPAPPPAQEEEENKWLLPLIIGVSVFLVVLLVSFIIYKKWGCFGLFRKKLKLAIPIKKISILSARTSVCSTTSSCGSLKVALKRGKKYGVRLSQAEVHVGKLEEDKDAGFSMEFQALKQLLIYMEPLSTGAALQSNNIQRNRFSNILPFDKTRVVLKKGGGGGDNDYINANYVSGYQFEREFIATQGPMKNTVNDFWNMCWESNSSCIVMLTRCYEKGVEKCYPYWPTEIGSRNCGGIRVTLEKQAAYRAEGHLWLVSHLLLEKDEEENEPRPIIHIAFLSWPDFGVVEPPQILISFVKEFRKLVPYPEKAPPQPVVIHCSAGVGRSGVFITLDYLMQQLQGDRIPNCINIFQIVARMRRERMAMVQTQAQYTLIYKCLLGLVNKTPLANPVMVAPDQIQVEDWGLSFDNNSNNANNNNSNNNDSKSKL